MAGSSAEVLDPDLLAHLRTVASSSPTVATISNGRPNRIRGVGPEGVWIETDTSVEKGSGASLVPAWMLNTGWRHLKANGTLTNRHLLAPDGLQVRRSSAVCALLARIPGVTVASSRPIELRLET